MFIAPASKQIRLKPHRGGMVRAGEGHAAPTELERIIGGTVTIDMSLLRSWACTSVCWTNAGFASVGKARMPLKLKLWTTTDER